MGPIPVVVGRQPIFDVGRDVVGYELLFRPAPDASTADGGGRTGDEMTDEALEAATQIGIEKIVGDKTLFCNADRGVLTGAVPLHLPPKQTVVELLETVTVDGEIRAGCRRLLSAGYRIALDDFTWFPGAERVLELASIVKLDILDQGITAALELADRVRPYDVTLLAEKVETDSQFTLTRDRGFELFQGFALAHPTTLTGTAPPGTAVAALELAGAILDEYVEFSQIETIVRHDPALAARLLKIAAIDIRGQPPRPVRTIRDALALLGTQKLKSWVSLLLITAGPDAHHDQVLTVLLRARMCELLAEREDPAAAPVAFTAGMLSALDRLLGIPPDQMAARLDIDTRLLGAAFHRAGPTGRFVGAVIDYEAGRRHTDNDHLRAAAAHATRWAMRANTFLTTT